jgi:pimeloyl-ACP methyl ester carboxylesterase
MQVSHLALAAMLLVWPMDALIAQAGVIEQDSTLNNLVHAADYRVGELGTVGAVVRRGSGPIDVLLIPGWGFGAEVFDTFMRANEHRFRMVAVTLPGFAGTAAPPMPSGQTSYAEATWTRAAEAAVARVLGSERLRKPIVVGHFIVGTQVALGLAVRHADLIGGLVIVGGEPMRYVPSRRDSTGKTPMPRDERARGIDEFMAPRWFRTVTKRSFDLNNYAAAQYSRDSARAKALWQMSSAVPLPVMVRYLCEYMASDLRDDLARIAIPAHVLVPGLSAEILADPKQAYAKTFFIDSWENVRAANPSIVIRNVPDSRVFITDDQPGAVQQAIEEVAAVRRRVQLKP